MDSIACNFWYQHMQEPACDSPWQNVTNNRVAETPIRATKLMRTNQPTGSASEGGNGQANNGKRAQPEPRHFPSYRQNAWIHPPLKYGSFTNCFRCCPVTLPRNRALLVLFLPKTRTTQRLSAKTLTNHFAKAAPLARPNLPRAPKTFLPVNEIKQKRGQAKGTVQASAALAGAS